MGLNRIGSNNTGGIAYALLTALLCAIAQPGLAAEPKTAVKKPLQEIALTDQADLENERRIHTVIKREVSAEKEVAGRFAGKRLTEIDPWETAFLALRKNLSIRRGDIAEQIAKQALLEAQAVFDPVLALSVAYDHSETFTREIEGELRFRRGTQFMQGRHILMGDPADPRGTQVEINQARPEGFSPSGTILASQAPITGPTKRLTYDVSLFQQLPWGATLFLTYEAIDQDRFFTNFPAFFRNNPNPRPNFVAFGSFDRPWISSLLATLVLPVPGSKNFGPYADQEVAIKLADLGKDRAYWVVEDIINTTLRDVDITYWNLVNSLLSLQITLDNRQQIGTLLEKTQGLYDRGEATTYDKAQAEAELARIQGEEERAWNNYVLASDALVRLLDKEADELLLPVGFTKALKVSFPPAPLRLEELAAAGSADNPARIASLVDVQAARIEQRRRAVRTRPDLNFVADVAVQQSNSRFGYESFEDSVANVVEPDLIQQTYSLEYLYPWGNRAVKAQHAAAKADTKKQDLLLRQTDNRIIRDINNAWAALRSADNRIAITGRNVQLAKTIYDKALQQQAERAVTEYELVLQSGRLLTAEQNHIRAQTQRKRAEARLLAALGRLPRVYAERIAQTDLDRYRLKLLSANHVLRHFGEVQ
jgi:outer membrane protein TolC